MDFSQLIGFVIVLLVLVLPILQKAIQARYRKKHPEHAPKQEEEEEDEFDQFLHSLDMGEQGLKEKRAAAARSMPPPLPHELEEDLSSVRKYADEAPQIKQRASHQSRRALENFRFRSNLDDYHQVSAVETRQLKERIQPNLDPHVVSLDLEVKPAEIVNRPQVEPMTAHIQRLVRERTIGREMILMYEILSPPKSLR